MKNLKSKLYGEHHILIYKEVSIMSDIEFVKPIRRKLYRKLNGQVLYNLINKLNEKS